MTAPNGQPAKKSPTKKKAAPTASRIPPVALKSLAGRVETLEEQVAELIKLNLEITAVVARLLENHAVAAAMPAVEQQLRDQIQKQIKMNGFSTAL